MRILFLIGILFLASNALYGQKWKEGYYYTNKGVKVKGLIRHVFRARFGSKGDNSIVFKASKKAQKVKFDSYKIKGFVIAEDSFGIVKNFDLNALAHYERDFAEVVITGPLSLLKHYSTVTHNSGGVVTTSTVTTSLLSKGNRTVRMSKKKDFKNVLPELIGDAPSLLQKVQNEEYDRGDLKQIVEEYNRLVQKE